MPRFYFDILHNGHQVVDQSGYDFLDTHQAHREAVKTIAAIAAEEIPKDGVMMLSIAVSDQNHRLLFTTHVSFEPGLSDDKTG